MKKQSIINNQSGFTLVEIIAVLIILGILAAVAVPRYIDLESNAKQRAFDSAIAELNGRESLAWADEKISPSGWVSDTKTFGRLNKDLGEGFQGSSILIGGGTLQFKSESLSVNRSASMSTRPGNWYR